MNEELFAGKTVLVMGLGRFGGGVDVAKFAAAAGARVIVTDLAAESQLGESIDKLKEFPHIEFHLGSHDPADFEQADIIVVNPAVAPHSEFLQLARRHRKFITSQINIFFELCPVPIIGITGANGKSTTAALTAHLLRGTRGEGRETDRVSVIASEAKQSETTRYAIRNTQYEHVWLSGNIGNEPLLTVTDRIGPDDLVVLELSSFQLEQLAQVQRAPQTALLTNLTPNHLDRYGTFDAYCAAKENIFKFQKPDRKYPALSIFNADDEIAAEWFEKYKKDAGRTCIKFSADDISREIRDRFTLPGRANLSNLAAAVAIARQFGVTDEQIENSLPHFKPLPHRLELVAEIDGVRWYNDSKATTPQGAITALEAFAGPRIIIAGGYDKHLPFDELGREISQNAKAVILLGQTAQKIAEAIRRAEDATQGTQMEFAASFTEAVELADRLAVPGDVVLLSPACASYDMFENYEQRGREFARLVQAIRPKSRQASTQQESKGTCRTSLKIE